MLIVIDNFLDYLPKSIKKFSDVIYTFVEYSSFAFILGLIIKSKKIRIAIFCLSIGFYFFQVIYFLNFQKKGIDSIPIGVETILVFMYLFTFFYYYLKSIPDQPVYSYYGFWISFGIIIYLGSTFFIYILANNLEPKEREKFWDFTYIPDIIKNILFCISIWTYLKAPNTELNKSNKKIPFLDMI